jgi:hypothetical protein
MSNNGTEKELEKDQYIDPTQRAIGLTPQETYGALVEAGK